MGLWIGYGIKRKLAYHIIKVVEICQRTRLEYYEILGENFKLKEEIKELKEKHPAPSGQGNKRGGIINQSINYKCNGKTIQFF